jgi:hypothetical protein
MSDTKDIQYYIEKLQILKEMTEIQCTDGNWNYNEYMLGLANGMIYAISIFENKDPKYLKAPKVWKRDKSNKDKPISVEPK